MEIVIFFLGGGWAWVYLNIIHINFVWLLLITSQRKVPPPSPLFLKISCLPFLMSFFLFLKLRHSISVSNTYFATEKNFTFFVFVIFAFSSILCYSTFLCFYPFVSRFYPSPPPFLLFVFNLIRVTFSCFSRFTVYV